LETPCLQKHFDGTFSSEHYRSALVSLSMQGTHSQHHDTSSPLPDPALLPNDVDQLKEMILELMATLRKHRQDNRQLHDRLDQLLRRLYGPRAERYDPNQLLLFADLLAPAEPAPTPAPSPAPAAASAPKDKKPGHGRKPLPKNLRRERIEYTLSAAERLCPCCGELRQEIGVDVSSQLDFQPASLFVVEHAEHSYACAACQGQVVRAAKAPQVIDKGLPGPGLLAQVIVSKFLDHLPLYRQEQIFQRQGVEVARSTMGDWMAQTAAVLKPLYDEMVKRVLSSLVIHTDDTRLPVLDAQREQTREAHVWVYLGDWTNPFIVFDYTPDRKGAGPQKFLENFQGYLQADAYTGYDRIFAGQDVVEVACNAHARRKFFEAKDGDDPVGAHRAIAVFRQLATLETDLRNAEEALRKAHPMTDVEAALFRDWWEEQVVLHRQEKALPIWTVFLEWLHRAKETALPKGSFGEAIRYVLNQEQALTRYLWHGFLELDNNVAEREMKRVATGRKNYLFTGSDSGGKTTAILYSFVSTCARHEINAFVYLRDVLRRLPTLTPEELPQLLPGKWELRPIKPTATAVSIPAEIGSG
jgi:transposase